MRGEKAEEPLSVPQAAVQGPNRRSVRVFVSSTFRDMHAEREELVKNIFPRLRRLCESRKVLWTDVDLRWGITEEQKAEKRILPICFAEIEKCRPFFIGLLGERYGAELDEIDSELLELQPWLSTNPGKSLTELEIIHGALNNPSLAEHAFFYFRDPASVFGRPGFDGTPMREEYELWGFQEAERRAHEARCKLASLKERIRASGLSVHEEYADPKALGELVLRDLTAVIDRKYPRAPSEALDDEAAKHEAFAEARTRVYIGRTANFKRLDAHVERAGPPLVVIGKPGSGKSALLANWALAYRRAHPDCAVVIHFVGASANSSSKAAIMRHIVSELGRCVDPAIEIPEQADMLPTAFASVLQTGAGKRVVLILDGLDHTAPDAFAEPMNSVDLWLPKEIAPSFRLILSGWFSGLEDRRWPTLEVAPLQVDERERLIVDYLARFGKELSQAQVQQIANAESTANPLYLSALLDELRQYGDHLTLKQRVEHYLAAADLKCLYGRILARYDEDFEVERPHLVRDALSLIWGARLGLAESELRDLLGASGDPLPTAHWLRLYLAGEQLFVTRSGLIGLAHDHIRRAVGDRYIQSEEARRAVHQRLANYFDARDLSFRKIAELPTQLLQANDWARLYVLVVDDLEFRAAVSDIDKFEWPLYATRLMGVLQTELSPTLVVGAKRTSTRELPVEQQWGVCQRIIRLRHDLHLSHQVGQDSSLESTASQGDKIRRIEMFRKDLTTLLFRTVLTPEQQAEFHRKFEEKMQNESFREDFRKSFHFPAVDHSTARGVDIPSPHQAANPERAAQLNIRYQRDLAAWRELPWWKRRGKEPKPPTGI